MNMDTSEVNSQHNSYSPIPGFWWEGKTVSRCLFFSRDVHQLVYLLVFRDYRSSDILFPKRITTHKEPQRLPAYSDLTCVAILQMLQIQEKRQRTSGGRSPRKCCWKRKTSALLLTVCKAASNTNCLNRSRIIYCTHISDMLSKWRMCY